METIAQKDDLDRSPDLQYAGTIVTETDRGPIKGILWGVAIMAPIYAVIVWALVS